YIENEFGIRIENELVCKKAEENEYGQFMEFETITFCPVDLDAVDTKYLDASDIEMLNNYNKIVYEKISPYLNEEEKEWLGKETRMLS
ncbi:MAG TPA: peptidase M24, partial [Eubacterium sp.]|nr:peptidase M24 [Eubacterium sp.]